MEGSGQVTNGTGSRREGETVVIAMDGSEYSDYALQFYMKSIHRPGNHVILAHSTEYSNITFPAVGMLSGDSMMAMVTHEMDEEERNTAELVEKLTKKMQNLKISGSIERLHGVPGPAIIALAAEKHADFIVVGCRGKGSVRRTLTGSVTDYIMHHSGVPVIVARHKDHLEHHQGFHIHNPFHKKHEEHNSS